MAGDDHRFGIGETYGFDSRWVHGGNMNDQCGNVYTGAKTSRGTTYVFCTRDEGHKGDHRGTGKQWTKKGKRVKITLPPDAR